MAQYQVWVLDNAYSAVAYLSKWVNLKYRVALNNVSGATVQLLPNDPKIEDIALMNRLRIVRDGVDVYGGLLLAESWEIAQEAPAGEVYTLDALDHAVYAEWRTIARPSGEDYDSRTGKADDVAKEYVYYHMGAGADAARQYSDITIEADESDGPDTSRTWVGGTLLNWLQRLGRGSEVWWRFVPSATGAEFRTAYPLWGLDRTKGNGVNDECVLTLDRRNVLQMAYRRDALNHYNTMYVAGAGEGKDQPVEVRQNAGYVTAWKRREKWIDAGSYTETTELQTEGDYQIRQYLVAETMSALPKANTWGVLWNLGDQITVYANRYGRTFTMEPIITAVDVEVTEDGLETATPVLEVL